MVCWNFEAWLYTCNIATSGFEGDQLQTFLPTVIFLHPCKFLLACTSIRVFPWFVGDYLAAVKFGWFNWLVWHKTKKIHMNCTGFVTIESR